MSDDKLPMWIDPETVRQLLRGAKPDAPIQERLRNPPKPYRPVALREEAAARIATLEAQLAEAVEALEPFAFTDDATTQEAWETRYRDRFKDWIDFDDIDRARRALAKIKGAEG